MKKPKRAPASRASAPMEPPNLNPGRPDKVFELPPLRRKKPVIPETPVVAVDTAIRLKAEVAPKHPPLLAAPDRSPPLPPPPLLPCPVPATPHLTVWLLPAVQTHFNIHDVDNSGTLDLYQMVLALQAGA